MDKENAWKSMSPLFIAADRGHLAVVQCLLEHGADVNKAKDRGDITPLHAAVLQGHTDVAICLMESGLADLNARITDGRLPMDLATNDEMRQAIINEEKRRRNHGYRRAVIPNPTPAEQEAIDRARREAGGEGQGEGEGQATGCAEAEGQGQGSANAVAEEDDDDSGSDEPHEVAYLRSLKRKRSNS